MNGNFVTITCFHKFYGLKPFAIGNLIRCRKDPDNIHDGEAIRCSLPVIGTVGYIANSPNTVAGGTASAGRIYDRMPERFYVRVLFTTATKVICRVEAAAALDSEHELRRQMDADWENDAWNEEDPAC